jgi:SAM-dependent methyltransferase
MSLSVLPDRQSNLVARREMKRAGASVADNGLRRSLRRLGLGSGTPIGDHRKSWDVWTMARRIRDEFALTDPVVDMGAFASEIPIVLDRLGFTNIHALDLNEKLLTLHYPETVTLTVGDMMSTPFDDGSFAAVTSVSVIEHGFDQARLLAEVSRLLRPGGLFLASFDYWPDKIDTSDIELFGMPWNIFSKDEALTFVASAAATGLEPVGELDSIAREPTIRFASKEFTFGLLVLRKTVG